MLYDNLTRLRAHRSGGGLKRSGYKRIQFLAKHPITLACWDYDRTRALADGIVQPDGIALNYLSLPVEEIFFSNCLYGVFSVNRVYAHFGDTQHAVLHR